MYRLIVEKGDYRAIWGSLTNVCDVYGLPYHSLKVLDFPIECNGYIIRKVRYKTK